MNIRALRTSDLDSILRIQAQGYADSMLESAETFMRKMELFPQGCIGCVDATGLHAYLFSHPWKGEDPVPLDVAIQKLPEYPDCYYLHDLCVERAYCGKGLGHTLIHHVMHIANNLALQKCALIAVQESEAFWSQFGFAPKKSYMYTRDVPGTFMTKDMQTS